MLSLRFPAPEACLFYAVQRCIDGRM